MDSERRLAEMVVRMQALQVEKEELELRNRILSRDLSAVHDHLEELWASSVRFPRPCRRLKTV